MHVPTLSVPSRGGNAYLSVARSQPAAPAGPAMRQQPVRPAPRFSSFLLDLADPGADSRVVLVGHGTLDLACELIRFGSKDVSIVRIGDVPHDAKADIVVVPNAGHARQIEQSIGLARRVLAPLGRLVMGGVPVDLVGIARAHLRMHGFGRCQSWIELDGLVVQAELPMSGGVACA